MNEDYLREQFERELHENMRNYLNHYPDADLFVSMGLVSPFGNDVYTAKPTALPFCHCQRMPGSLDDDDPVMRFCPCGEWRRRPLDWSWDASSAPADKARLSGNQDSRVLFHPSFARGTALLRADRPLLAGSLNYFEIHVETPLLGTDTMIGIGTLDSAAAPDEIGYHSLIGRDSRSWGYSCNGYTQFDGVKRAYGSRRFGDGSLIGCAVDLQRGTIEFYLNRRPLGLAYGNLPLGQPLYAFTSSTCVKTVLKLTHTSHHPVNLQLLCMQQLARNELAMRSVREVHGLRRHCDRLFYMHCKERYVTPLELQLTGTELSALRKRPAWESQARWQPWLAEKRRRGSWYMATATIPQQGDEWLSDDDDAAEADGADDVGRQLYGDIVDETPAQEAPRLTQSVASQTCNLHLKSVPPENCG